MKEYKVPTDSIGQRLDVFVAAQYPQYTRSSLTSLFKSRLVTVNGEQEKAGYKLRRDDEIIINEAPLNTEPAIIDVPVIYEDDNVAVMDKPAGVLTHSKGAINDEATIASFIKSRLKDDKLKGNRAGIVHRLDRPTSGVIITAKTETALKHLQKQFSLRKTKKEYIAIVEGDLEPPEAIIDAPIMRNPKRPQTFLVNPGGKEAITAYKKIKAFEKDGRAYSLVDLKPRTGRTHQLRVHMAYINHPIVGDAVYGRDGKDMMLHAESLELTLPGGDRRIFQSDIPKRIKEFAGL